jgi:hypothetical protein
VDYSWQPGGVQVAQTTVDGGVTRVQRTQFDWRGNALTVDSADAPDFVWYPALRRSYDCRPPQEWQACLTAGRRPRGRRAAERNGRRTQLQPVANRRGRC